MTMAAVKGMSRFLNHEDVTLPALIEPLQDAIREAVAQSPADIVLVIHDWSMFSFITHTRKKDCFQRSHARDIGYDLGTALVVDGYNGRPLGPMEIRVHTARGILSTRPGGAQSPPAHIDELGDVMADSRRWNLALPIIHLIDREADSVGHYRQWHAAGHRFVVRGKSDRRVLWKGESITLQALQIRLAGEFRDPPGGPALAVQTTFGPARVQVLEASVTLDQPAKTWINGVQKKSPWPTADAASGADSGHRPTRCHSRRMAPFHQCPRGVLRGHDYALVCVAVADRKLPQVAQDSRHERGRVATGIR